MSGTSSTASSGFVQGILIGGGVVFFVAGMIVLGGIPSDIISPSSGGVDNGTNTAATTTGSMQTSTSATQTSTEAQTSKQGTTAETTQPSQTTQPQTTQPAQTTKTTTRTTSTTTGSQETVLYRVNLGGPRLPSSDGGPAWMRDTENRPSRFGNARTSGSHTNSTDDPISMTNAVPEGTPESVFQSRRYDADNPNDPSDDTEMEYRFPVESGTYEVRVYLAETYFDDSGWNDYQENGPRTFDIEVEGDRVLDDYDMYAELGHDRGTVKSYTVTVRDGHLNVRFLHEQEDPMISGIEVVRVDGDEQNDRSNKAFAGKDNGEKGEEKRDEMGGKDERDDDESDERDDSRIGGDGLLDSTLAELRASRSGGNWL